MVLSHFLPELTVLSSPRDFSLPPPAPLPRFLVRSSLVQLPLAAPATQFPVAAASGWRVERTTLATLTSSWSGQNEVVMETYGPGYTLGHTPGNMADLTLLSFYLALDKGVDHLARGFRKGYPRWASGKELATRRETPWASGCISWKDPLDPPSATHPLPQCPLYGAHNVYRCATCAHRRDATPDTRFSLWSTRIARAVRAQDIGLNSVISIRGRIVREANIISKRVTFNATKIPLIMVMNSTIVRFCRFSFD